MTTEERNRKLQEAMWLIEEVKDTFSNEKKICQHCGFEMFVNYNDRHMREQLNGALTRLARVMDRAERTEGVEKHPKHPEERERYK